MSTHCGLPLSLSLSLSLPPSFTASEKKDGFPGNHRSVCLSDCFVALLPLPSNENGLRLPQFSLQFRLPPFTADAGKIRTPPFESQRRLISSYKNIYGRNLDFEIETDVTQLSNSRGDDAIKISIIIYYV